MIQFSFFHSPKPRGFNHNPIYWNPDDDSKRERDERLRAEANGDHKTTIKRGSFRQQRWNADADADVKKTRQQSNQRFLLIFAVLLLLAVCFFYFI